MLLAKYNCRIVCGDMLYDVQKCGTGLQNCRIVCGYMLFEGQKCDTGSKYMLLTGQYHIVVTGYSRNIGVGDMLFIDIIMCFYQNIIAQLELEVQQFKDRYVVLDPYINWVVLFVVN